MQIDLRAGQASHAEEYVEEPPLTNVIAAALARRYNCHKPAPLKIIHRQRDDPERPAAYSRPLP